MQSAARTGNNNSRNFISDDQRTGGEREKEIKWWRWKKWNGQHLCLLCRRGIPSIKGGKENVHHPHVEILVRHTYTHALTQSRNSLQLLYRRRKKKTSTFMATDLCLHRSHYNNNAKREGRCRGVSGFFFFIGGQKNFRNTQFHRHNCWVSHSK